MSSSDIKAGGAYVEIDGKSAKFEQAMDKVELRFKSVMSSISGFGSTLATAGAGLAALGGMAIGPLAGAAREYADFGEQIGKLKAKTGMSAEFLTGMSYAAGANGVSMQALSGATKNMQKAVSGSSKEAGAALAKLGVDADALKGMSADEKFLTLSDAVAGVSDPGERAAAAMSLFGKSGIELLPIIEGGSAAIRGMVDENKKLGGSFSDDVLAHAAELDDTFDRMERGAKNLRLELGDQLFPILKPIADRVVDMTVAGTKWIEQNPELIQTFVKGAVEVAALGTAMLVTGGAIMALMSPAFLATAAITMIIGAVAAVSDVTGNSDLGFGELFNSVRISGVGLGTWLSEVALTVQSIWISVAAKIGEQFRKIDTMVNASEYGNKAYDLEKGADMARVLAKGAKTEEDKRRYEDQANKFDKEASVFRSKQSGTYDDGIANEAKIQAEAAQKLAEVKAKMESLFEKDYQDNGKTFEFNSGAAKDSVLKIFNNVWDGIGTQLEGLLGKIPKIDFTKPDAKVFAPSDVAAALPMQGPKFGSFGTFSAFGGAELAGNGVFDSQLRESQKQTQLLNSIDKKTGTPGGLA